MKGQLNYLIIVECDNPLESRLLRTGDKNIVFLNYAEAKAESERIDYLSGKTASRVVVM